MMGVLEDGEEKVLGTEKGKTNEDIGEEDIDQMRGREAIREERR